MKIRSTQNLESATKKEIRPDVIDLTKISSIINELNAIVAPTISVDLAKVEKIIEAKGGMLKTSLLEAKKSNDEFVELQKQKMMIIKKTKVMILLSELHTNFKVNDNIKVETLNIIRDIDTYSEKRLNVQIEKLEKILSK